MRYLRLLAVCSSVASTIGCADMTAPREPRLGSSSGGVVVTSPKMMNSALERPEIGEAPIGARAAYGNPALRPVDPWLAVVGVETGDIHGWVGGLGFCVPTDVAPRQIGGSTEGNPRDLIAGVWVKFDF